MKRQISQTVKQQQEIQSYLSSEAYSFNYRPVQRYWESQLKLKFTDAKMEQEKPTLVSRISMDDLYNISSKLDYLQHRQSGLSEAQYNRRTWQKDMEYL